MELRLITTTSTTSVAASHAKLLNGKKFRKEINELECPKNQLLCKIKTNLQASEVCVPLRFAFGDDNLQYLCQLVEYAATEVRLGELNLKDSEFISDDLILRSINYLSHCNKAMYNIRESGNLTIIRIVIELLHRLAMINLPDPRDQEIRRSTCALIDVVLINMANPRLCPSHVYLFTYALRALLHQKKLPFPSLIRMQQIEYLLDPWSRYCYARRGDSRAQKDFHERLSEKLMNKYAELQGDLGQRQADIKSKARVFEIVTKIVERLFGVSPYLFGSGASGLAISQSDLDVVVLQPVELIKDMVAFAQSWKEGNEPDFCPFPSISRVRSRAPRVKGKANKKVRPLIFKLQRLSQFGTWRWLKRSPPEVAAIWSGRILANRLVRFGWKVECVETARVPILRIVAAVNNIGRPTRVPSGIYLEADNPIITSKPAVPTPPISDNESRDPLAQVPLMKGKKRPNEVLDPLLTVGKTRDWNGTVPNPSSRGEMKHFSELTNREKKTLNQFIRHSFDQRVAQDIDCPVDELGNSVTQQSHDLSQNSISVIHQNGTSLAEESTSSAPSKNEKIHFVNLDISFNHEIVVHNTRLMKSYAECDPLIPVLGILLKHWAKQRGICDSYNGTLSGYQYMLLIIHYLQHLLIQQPGITGWVPVLPNLQNPPPEFPRYQLRVDGRHDAYFYHPFKGPNRNLDILRHQPFPLPSNTRPLSQLPHCHLDINDPHSPNDKSLYQSKEIPFPLTTKSHDGLLKIGTDPLSAPLTPIDFPSSDWPEDVFRGRPFEYAKQLLTPLDVNGLKKLRRNPNAEKEINALNKMRKHSKPGICTISKKERDSPTAVDEKQSTGTCLPVWELKEDLDSFVVKCPQNTISNLFYGFFEYFGFRFNCHTHIIDINRTPKLPQRKTDFFVFPGSTGAADSKEFDKLDFDVRSTPYAPPRTPDGELSPTVVKTSNSQSIDNRSSITIALENQLSILSDSSNRAIDLLIDFNWDSISSSTRNYEGAMEDDEESEKKEDELIDSTLRDSNDQVMIEIENSQECCVDEEEYENEEIKDDDDDDNDDDLDDETDNDFVPVDGSHIDLWTAIYGSSLESETRECWRERNDSYEATIQEIIRCQNEASRNLSAFRQRQFYCILDPFEQNRIIGPPRREGFTLMVFELIRARDLILKQATDLDRLVENLFSPSKMERNGSSHLSPYFVGPNYTDTPYRHFPAEHYNEIDRKHSVDFLWPICEQIGDQVNSFRRCSTGSSAPFRIKSPLYQKTTTKDSSSQRAMPLPSVTSVNHCDLAISTPATQTGTITSRNCVPVSRESMLAQRPKGILSEGSGNLVKIRMESVQTIADANNTTMSSQQESVYSGRWQLVPRRDDTCKKRNCPNTTSNGKVSSSTCRLNKERHYDETLIKSVETVSQTVEIHEITTAAKTESTHPVPVAPTTTKPFPSKDHSGSAPKDFSRKRGQKQGIVYRPRTQSKPENHSSKTE